MTVIVPGSRPTVAKHTPLPRTNSRAGWSFVMPVPAADVEVELREAGIEPAEQPIAWAEPDDLPMVDVDFSSLVVRDEVLRKAATDPRFRSDERVWNRLPDKYLEILSDDETPELNVAVARISGRATTAFRQSSRPIRSPPTCSNARPRGSDRSSRAAVVCGLRSQPMITSARSRMRSHEPRLAARPGSAVGPGGQRAT
ncbi:hypothetical protein ACQPZA_35310 [Pseudonocardia xinjiangensis]|uniref:hypothetical protein n=1 Tax=Pseudonocardia xinjiangensis TaxID=75289 RepID=UPI003D93BE66